MGHGPPISSLRTPLLIAASTLVPGNPAILSFCSVRPRTTASATATPPSTPVLNLAPGTISFEGGNLPTDFSDDISIAPNNKVTATSTDHLSLIFAPATGAFRGSVRPPGLNRSWPFAGVVFQKQNSGF